MLNPSLLRQWVDLSSADPESDGVAYAPARVKCAIRPGAPGAFDERGIAHQVELRYHPQVSLNTRLTFVDRHNVSHVLFVRGLQDVDLQNRWLVLHCEEVLTP